MPHREYSSSQTLVDVAQRVERCRAELASAFAGSGPEERLAAAQARARLGAQALAAALAAADRLERPGAPALAETPAKRWTDAEALRRVAEVLHQATSVASVSLLLGAVGELSNATSHSCDREVLLHAFAEACDAAGLLTQLPGLVGGHVPATLEHSALLDSAAAAEKRSQELGALCLHLSETLARQGSAEAVLAAAGERDDAESALAASLRAVGSAAAAAEARCEERERFAARLEAQSTVTARHAEVARATLGAEEEGVSPLLAAGASALLARVGASDEAMATLVARERRQMDGFAAFGQHAAAALNITIDLLQAALRDAALQANAADASAASSADEASALAAAAERAGEAAAEAAAARRGCARLRLACEQRTSALLELEDRDSERRKGQLRGDWGAAAEAEHVRRCTELRTAAEARRVEEEAVLAEMPKLEAAELSALRLAVQGGG